MSTISITIQLDSSDANFNAVIDALANLSDGSDKIKDLKVKEAEVVETEKPKPAPKPKAPAKPKPAPVEEPEEEEFDEDLNGPSDDEHGADEEITLDDLRALQATKVDKNREALKAKFTELGATGLSSLKPEDYQAYYDFLAKLK